MSHCLSDCHTHITRNAYANANTHVLLEQSSDFFVIIALFENLISVFLSFTMDSEVIKEKIHTEPMLNDPRYITLLSLIVLLFTLGKSLRNKVNKIDYFRWI